MGARLSASVQTGPGSHPASYTVGTGSFPGGKTEEVDYPPTFSAEVEGRVELYNYFLSGPSWPVLGRTLPLPLPLAYYCIRYSVSRSVGTAQLNLKLFASDLKV